MIPLQYRLRASVRLEPAAGGARGERMAAWHVISEVPLGVMTVNDSAAQLLELTQSGASVTEIAERVGAAEERIFTLCERLRRGGVLEIVGAEADAGFQPPVTIVIPTRDRAGDLEDCLHSLRRVDYPSHRREVIVVDDGSADSAAIAGVAACHGARLLVNEANRGPAFSRNRAAHKATGEILAFVDSDCVVSTDWLRELVPYFAWERVEAVGGRTTGYYGKSRLDRYEQAASPLDMGACFRLETRGTDTFYVPTCNLLVRRSAYGAVAGLREDLRVGEDVDLCWRLRARGGYLVYAPAGIVRHKHRSSPAAMLRRRADYGTSEALLHKLHPDKRKRFPPAPLPLATLAILSAAVITLEPWLLPACLAPPAWDGIRRALRLRRKGVEMPARRIWTSVLRGHLSFAHSVFFHLVRYYLLPLGVAGLLTPGVWLLAGVAVLYVSAVDYSTRRPRIGYHTYLAYFLAEHVAYQTGVIAGCLRSRTFRSYLPAIRQPA